MTASRVVQLHFYEELTQSQIAQQISMSQMSSLPFSTRTTGSVRASSSASTQPSPRTPRWTWAFGHVREFVSPELTDSERATVRPPAPQPLPWPAPNLVLIRRDSFARVGPFSEDVKVGVTVDWYARATEAELRSTMLPDAVLERRLHLSNNGLRERDSRQQYLHVLKAALDRRRAQAPPDPPDPAGVAGGDLQP